MNGKIVLISMMLMIFFSMAFPQDKSKPADEKKELRYYRIDTVKTISGEITAIKSERSFHKIDFTVLYVKEKKSGKVYRVEVAPRWFFDLDVVTGSYISVQGSFSGGNGINQIMTRSITFQGGQHHFRGSTGFPMWRNTKRGKKFRERGNHRRRGSGRRKHGSGGGTGSRGMH